MKKVIYVDNVGIRRNAFFVINKPAEELNSNPILNSILCNKLNAKYLVRIEEVK